MNDYCSYCFRQLYGNEECTCEKTIIEKRRDKEIEYNKQAIISKYNKLLQVDEIAIKEFKEKNKRYTPSYW
jgi:hypothetical protein